MANLDLGLPGYSSLFSSQEERNHASDERVETIQLEDIQPFKQHPFHVQLDDDMVKLIDSIQENGVLMPILVRPQKDGNGYEMIAGHRRKFALETLGITTAKAIIRNLDDDQATILMVDSNIQRESISPIEKAYAYKLRLDAMNHQGKSLLEKTTCAQVEYKSKNKKSIQILADLVGENRNQIRRYIRLTYLIEPLQQMVEHTHPEGYEISFIPAVELSFLSKDEQYDLLSCIDEFIATPSLAQAQQLKKASKDGTLTFDFMHDLLANEKPNQKVTSYIKWSSYDKYFPKTYTTEQKQKVVDDLLSAWARKRERTQER